MTANTDAAMAPDPHGIRHVVVVDDDESLLRVVATGLEHAGCVVTAFNRFDDAKKYLASAAPDILISDVRLGGSNGLHLIVMSKLRHPEMTAVVMTGYDDVVLKKDAEAAGAHYVVKPILIADLLDLLGLSQPVVERHEG
jgi:two-component system nitrogen regulation response regulator GlnG